MEGLGCPEQGLKEDLGYPEGRDKGGMEDFGALRGEGSKEGRRVWGLAVPSNTKTLGGLSPAQGEPPLLLTHPRGRASSLPG